MGILEETDAADGNVEADDVDDGGGPMSSSSRRRRGRGRSPPRVGAPTTRGARAPDSRRARRRRRRRRRSPRGGESASFSALASMRFSLPVSLAPSADLSISARSWSSRDRMPPPPSSASASFDSASLDSRSAAAAAAFASRRALAAARASSAALRSTSSATETVLPSASVVVGPLGFLPIVVDRRGARAIDGRKPGMHHDDTFRPKRRNLTLRAKAFPGAAASRGAPAAGRGPARADRRTTCRTSPRTCTSIAGRRVPDRRPAPPSSFLTCAPLLLTPRRWCATWRGRSRRRTSSRTTSTRTASACTRTMTRAARSRNRARGSPPWTTTPRTSSDGSRLSADPTSWASTSAR